jgi:bifunctional NMN adenylyltransferase/nudix hydrolase
MEIRRVVDPSEYNIGVIIARFQVDELHYSQKELLDDVCNNHKKVVLFLGIPLSSKPLTDPLDFATRKLMVQSDYPNIIILPMKDNRSDIKWSKNVDEQIEMAFNNSKALLYGSRDSFIPHYFGKNQTVELITDTNFSGTEVRKEIIRGIRNSPDYRAGIITGKADVQPIAYPTVDIACMNAAGNILLIKKLDDDKWRFPGGHVDPKDESYELSASRKFIEETGNSCEIADLTYVCSQKINDWRYRNNKDSIITTLFMAKFIFGNPVGTNNILEVRWFNIDELRNSNIEDMIMEEHVKLMITFLNTLNK